jgi:hypothetical protein
MDADNIELRVVLERFQDSDHSGKGVIHRSVLQDALGIVGCRSTDEMLDAAGLADKEWVNYERFLEWVMRDDAEPTRSMSASRCARLPHLPTTRKASKHDKRLSKSASQPNFLLPISAPRKPSKRSKHDERIPCIAPLTKTAEHNEKHQLPPIARPPLQSECAEHDCSTKQWAEGMFNSREAASDAAVASRPSSTLGFREQAALVIQESGRPGELVDDLQEISISDLGNRPALACWRSCHGLRLYRSEIVTKALRLVCSAPVPGLRGVSYLDVFKKLTTSGWEHHIFLFGGLVRDILRRKVGNDIDITFSAPTVELAEICQTNGYKFKLDGDYILIGDEKGEEYLEGMVITHNGITPPENSDFSMNWVFYDFCNDVIIDKTGFAVPAVIANRLEIPCCRDKWDSWLAIGGSRVLFRYYKFLIRGFEYDPTEMAYIARKLLELWGNDAEQTIRNGREVLCSLVSAQDSSKIHRLQQMVSLSFGMADRTGRAKLGTLKRRNSSPLLCSGSVRLTGVPFLTANDWWQNGWLHVLSP